MVLLGVYCKPITAGEKPFDTIEDLVQDGLITLYMEANNVDLYLKSARESRSGHRGDQPPPTSSSPAPTSQTECEHSGEPADSQSPPVPGVKVGKKNGYSPCTIPVKRDSVILGEVPSVAPSDELKDNSAQGEASILSPAAGTFTKPVSCVHFVRGCSMWRVDKWGVCVKRKLSKDSVWCVCVCVCVCVSRVGLMRCYE